MCELLIIHKADVNESVKGRTPLDWAVDGINERQNGNGVTCRLLIKHNADIAAFISKCNSSTMSFPSAFILQDEGTILHVGAANGWVGICEMLIEYKADVHALSKKGHTPLHIAALAGNRELGRLLIEDKSDVNALSKNKCTPLHYAALKGQESVCRLLLQHDASVNARSTGDITPLQLSNLGLGSGAGVAKLLSDAGAITTASARGTQPNDEEVQSEEEEEEDSD